MIVILSGAKKPKPKPSRGLHQKGAEFNRNFAALVKALGQDPLGQVQSSGGQMSEAAWEGTAADAARVHGVDVVFSLSYRHLPFEGQHVVNLTYVAGGIPGGLGEHKELLHLAQSSAEWDTGYACQELLSAKGKIVTAIRALSSVVSSVFNTASTMGLGRALSEWTPNSKALMNFFGVHEGVKWTVAIGLSIGKTLRGPAFVDVTNYTSMEFHTRRWAISSPSSEIAEGALGELGGEIQVQKKDVEDLLPGALRVHGLLHEALRASGFDPKGLATKSELYKNKVLGLETCLGKGSKTCFSLVSYGPSYKDPFTERDKDAMGVQSMALFWREDPEMGEGTQLIPSLPAKRIPPEEVTLGMIFEALERVNIRRQFEAKDEDRREAIEKVNKGDLLGAIESAQKMIFKRMEDPERGFDAAFHKAYLEAVWKAKQGDAAAVAEFVNSL